MTPAAWRLGWRPDREEPAASPQMPPAEARSAPGERARAEPREESRVEFPWWQAPAAPAPTPPPALVVEPTLAHRPGRVSEGLATQPVSPPIPVDAPRPGPSEPVLAAGETASATVATAAIAEPPPLVNVETVIAAEPVSGVGEEMEAPAVAEPPPVVGVERVMAAAPVSGIGEEAEAPAVGGPLPVAGVETIAAMELPPDAGESVVLRCLELEESGLHAELVALAARSVLQAPLPVEGVTEAGEIAAVDRAALLALLARGRAALGDAAGAEAALGACEGVAVDTRDPATASRLRRIGGRIGRRLLLWAESTAEDSDERLRALEMALTWLDRTQRAGPGDGDATALATHTGEELATAREQRIAALVGRQEFHEALKQLESALAGGGLRDERRRALGELVWTSLTGDIGRLIGQALHGPAGRQALGVMREAERLTRSPLARKLSRQQRQDLDRRIRWGYVRLGTARIEAGDLAGSLDVLARAMGMVPPKASVLRGAPSALAPTIEALVLKWSDRIVDLERGGERDAAMSEARGLSQLIDAAFARGLSAEELRPATDRRQALMLEIAGEPPP